MSQKLKKKCLSYILTPPAYLDGTQRTNLYFSLDAKVHRFTLGFQMVIESSVNDSMHSVNYNYIANHTVKKRSSGDAHLIPCKQL